MKIMVVDDNREIAHVLGKMLHYEGHQVRTAGSGTDGLMIYLRSKPDVVITDLQMPHMNGFELIAAIRARNHEVKSIYMSADPDRFLSKLKEETAEDRSDWLSKPFGRDELLRSIAEILTSP